MSTTINVTVDGGGLVERSRQQTQANRFAKAERDQDAKAEAQAKEKKAVEDKKQEQLGVLRTGSRLNQDPAANRRTTGGILLVPTQAPFNANGDIRGKSTYTGADLFLKYVSGNGYDIAETNRPIVYSPSGGPSDAAYIEGDDSWFIVDLEYGVIRGITTSGGLAVSTNSLSLQKFKNFTFECYLREARSGVELAAYGYSYSEAELLLLDQEQRGAQVYLTATRARNIYTDNVYTATYGRFIADNGVSYAMYDYNDSDDEQPALPLGTWRHFALVKRGNDLKLFIDGVSFAPTNTEGLDQIDQIFNSVGLVQIKVRFGFGAYAETIPGTSAPQSPSAIHGLRFTPKALYTESFTPPPVIDRLK